MYSTGKIRTLAFLSFAATCLSACMQAGGTPPEPVATPPEPVVEQTPEPAVSEQPPATIDRLVGTSPKETVSLLGEPSLMRRDGPVQIMLFENHDCVLEVVFMEPNPDAHFEATHVTARSRDGAAADAQACLAQVLPDGVWPDGQ